MKKIAFAAATILALSGAAFAEEPNGGGPDINTIAQQQQQVDTIRTSSIGQDSSAYKLLTPGNTIAEQNQYAVRTGHRDFGNR